jgi:hypothetical protein
MGNQRTLGVALFGLLSLAACAEEKKLGMTEAERKTVYLTILQERPGVRSRLLREQVEAHLALLSANRLFAQQQTRHVASPDDVSSAYGKLLKNIKDTAQLQKDYLAFQGGSADRFLGKTQQEWDELAQTATELRIGQRSGLAFLQVREIVEEGKMKEWKGIAHK